VTAGAPLRNDLVVVLTDASELGALGARAFAEGHPWMADLDVVVAAEMRGVSGPAFLVERNERGGPILAAARADEPILASSLARELPGLAGVAPDARVLREEGGVRAATLVALGGLEAHHRVGDLAARVSERTLQHEGAQLLALTRSLGAADLGDASVREAPVPAYLSLPWIGVVPHPASWTLPMTLAILAGWGAALFLLRAAGRPLRAVLAGSAFGLAIVALGAGAGWALLAGVRALHPEYGALASAVYEDGVHALALVLTVVALVAAAYALARPRLGSREIFLGALAVPMALAAGLTLRAPHAAASVQPAAALAVVAALAVAMVPPARRRGGWAWAGFLALSGAMLVVLVPALELLAAALTLRGAPLLGGAVAACLLLFLPLLDWLIAPRWWWTPALAGAAAAALVLTAVPMVRPAAHPVRTSLAYLAEGAAGGADVGSAPLAAPAVPFTAAPATAALAAPAGDVLAAPRRARRVVGQWLTVPGPGEEWARSWVGVPATGPTDPGAIFLPGGAWEVAGSGPPAEIALPEVAVVEERLDGAMRRVQLALRPGLDAEMVAIRIPDDAPGELTALGDREWGGGDPPVRALEHWGRPADGALGVGVALDASAPELVLEVIEHHLRPREVLGPSYFERSRDLVPDATTGSDRVIQRTRVRLPLDGAPARMAGGPS
ncbi:MAG TPA: M28 family peptidase, partial [Longimicrobiales bacterium]|nr:M28 family peptidase [Longimicrobiales bacterium]